MKDQKFEEKFNYLLKEAKQKFNIENTETLSADNLIKVENTLNYLENKKAEKCKNEIAELSKHSSNFSKLENLEMAYAEKGQQKEFEDSKLKLQECLKPINIITKNLKEQMSYFDNIIQGSFDLCLDYIKDDIKKGKANEQVARTRIDACCDYLIRSKNTSSKMIDPILESVMEKY